ncbi:MAG: 16S rRNA (guanine(966)-N(2))-methyltransferase RsmD [Pseudomonadota bacterium]
MRIIGGKFKGARINAPKGRVARPTADRTRESLFNILANYASQPLDGAKVVDLFAGSGALGLEALSRGASYALFVETDAGARGAIRENIEALGVFGATRIHRRSAEKLGTLSASAGGPFNIAFLDPPYGKGLAEKALESLQQGGWLHDQALVIVEQGAQEEPVALEGLERLDRRDYGAGQITFFSHIAAPTTG